jgi:hypothetical protein
VALHPCGRGLGYLDQIIASRWCELYWDRGSMSSKVAEPKALQRQQHDAVLAPQGPSCQRHGVRSAVRCGISHTTMRKTVPVQKIHTPLSRVDADGAGGET